MTTTALALLLLGGTAPTALAQEQPAQGGHAQEHGGGARPTHPRGEAHERAVQGGQPGRGQPGRGQARPQPAPAPAAPQARPAPTAPAPQGPRAEHFQGGGRVQGGGRWHGVPPGQVAGRRGGEGRSFQGRPDRWVDHEGDNPGAVQSPGGRADHEDRQELGEFRRFNGGRGGVWEGDRRSADGPQAHGHDDRHGRPQWRPGAYPRSFHSAHRYRVGPYVRPPHFHTHVWVFGEYLPGSWFGPDYVIDDWWNYDLPAPPPGFDWVRVGDDALLIDEYTGRIVQVVRQLFW